jgi:hypothetical protein
VITIKVAISLHEKAISLYLINERTSIKELHCCHNKESRSFWCSHSLGIDQGARLLAQNKERHLATLIKPVETSPRPLLYSIY